MCDVAGSVGGLEVTVYVVTFETESGDRGVVGYFDIAPTDGHLTAYFLKFMPSEFETVDGETLRYVHWDVHELKAAKLPKPVKPIDSV